MLSNNLILVRFITPNLIPILPSFFSLHRTTTTSTTPSLSSLSLSTATYGPSLHKGTFPSKSPLNPQNVDEIETPPFDQDKFTRVFEISAIRVPSQMCFELESRIRGHLLNWPRVPNIARVPGDEIDEENRGFLMEKKVLEFEDKEEISRAVNRRVFGRGEGDGEELSGVLYRDKLAKEFNAKGFVKFRNLAKISRPVKKKKKKGRSEGERSGEEEEKRRPKKSVVEVVEENGCFGGGGYDDGGDLSALLGDEFKGRKWRGSTRLLLLDETCNGRNFDELPEAVKVVI